jgi:hypothetical protein
MLVLVCHSQVKLGEPDRNVIAFVGFHASSSAVEAVNTAAVVPALAGLLKVMLVAVTVAAPVPVWVKAQLPGAKASVNPVNVLVTVEAAWEGAAANRMGPAIRPALMPLRSKLLGRDKADALVELSVMCARGACGHRYANTPEAKLTRDASGRTQKSRKSISACFYAVPSLA